MTDRPNPPDRETLLGRAEEMIFETPGFSKLIGHSLGQFHDLLQAENPVSEPDLPSPNIEKSVNNLRYLEEQTKKRFEGHSIRGAQVKNTLKGTTLRVQLSPDDRISKEDPSRLDLSPGSKSVPEISVAIRRMDSVDAHRASPEKVFSSGGYVVDIVTQRVSWRRGDRGPNFTGGNGVRLYITKEGGAKAYGMVTTAYTPYVHEKPIDIDPEEFKDSIEQTLASIANLQAI